MSAHRSTRIAAAISLAAAALLAPAALAQSIPAFSGADGAGTFTTGGRGGVVYHVTRLDTKYADTTAGGFLYGINDSNFKDASNNVIPRTIVFDVGGTVWLGRNPTDTEGWDSQDRISIGSNV